ncbi:MAG: hypothetical protein KAT26_05955 [Marinosulfonomonas sp.]|nr:hypothetical protein [Marinosulfonomonas sp.]
MKSMLRHIPTPPSIPSPSKAPAPLGMPKAPGATGKGGGLPPIPSAGDGNAMGGAMPGNIENIVGSIMKKISGKGHSSGDIQKLIKDFDLDQYRDENGKLTPPFSKEELQKYMKYVKSLP